MGEYQALIGRMEDLEDDRDLRDHRSHPQEGIPAEIVNRLMDGENPVKVWREYRCLTQAELAEKAQISIMHIGKMESGEREDSVKLLSRLATALNIDIDVLLWEDA